MVITRKSSNFNTYLKTQFNIEATLSGYEEVSLGYRQQPGIDDFGNEALVNVEVFGAGDALYTIDWLDEWGAPPSDHDLDNWAPEPVVEPPVLTLGERASLVKEKLDAKLFALYGELADESSVDEAVDLLFSAASKSLKRPVK